VLNYSTSKDGRISQETIYRFQKETLSLHHPQPVTLDLGHCVSIPTIVVNVNLADLHSIILGKGKQ
jgi:hypothetical protein